ncbi:MAG: type II toxin-antitoxin system RelE/ParE family toxin [Gammaproteobacteria bacterium]|nr:type II toxin-antitoxin system RelE/ParE family toxin [Gammaproteobacteria bacterium]
MIKTFNCKETKKLFSREVTKKIPFNVRRAAYRKLLILNEALTLNDLRILPGNNLELLKGDRKNLYSIQINKRWRICFEWMNGDKYNVEIADYH